MTFGLIGKKLGHSFSADHFSEKFRKEQLPHTYKLFELDEIRDLTSLIKNNPDLRGLNVTIPYKEAVIPFLHELSPEAESAGAVNTILIQDGKLRGYNTDIYGFRNSIKPFLEPRHQRALILGTGGAAKAVSFVFKELGIDHYFVSRTKRPGRVFLYEELNDYIMKSFMLIVNATPVGMHPNNEQFPEIPYDLISKDHFLYDLIYNPAETLFLAEGKARGAMTMNGLDMLRLQADRSWQIWNEN